MAVNKATKFLKQMRDIDNTFEDMDIQGFQFTKAQKVITHQTYHHPRPPTYSWGADLRNET